MNSRDEMEKILVCAKNLLHTISGLEIKKQEIAAKYRPTEGGYKKIWHGLRPIVSSLGI